MYDEPSGARVTVAYAIPSVSAAARSGTAEAPNTGAAMVYCEHRACRIVRSRPRRRHCCSDPETESIAGQIRSALK